MDAKGTDGRLEIKPNGDGTFRVALHTDEGSMTSCDFNAEQLNALAVAALFQLDAVK